MSEEDAYLPGAKRKRPIGVATRRTKAGEVSFLDSTMIVLA